jgi:phosphoesterase RecJ-like protein
MERLGTMTDVVSKSPAQKICIDHHYTNQEIWDIKIVDVDACATGELIFDYIRRFERDKLPYEIAEAIYIAILTDTGSFRFTNSTPRSHIITAELIEMGINPREVYSKVYESYSLEKIRLLAKALDRLQIDERRKIAWTTIPNEIMESINARREDVEGIVEQLSVIGGVDITLLFLELPNGKVKVSLRSKGSHNIDEIAVKFGGGGHKHAAGILFANGKLTDNAETVVEECKKLIYAE